MQDANELRNYRNLPDVQHEPALQFLVDKVLRDPKNAWVMG